MSKFIKLNNDFGVDRAKEPNTASDQEITASWIRAVVEAGYKGGLTQDKRRIWTLVKAKIDLALKENASFFEANPFEYAFLTAAFQFAVMDPKFTDPINLVENAVLNAPDEAPVDLASETETSKTDESKGTE